MRVAGQQIHIQCLPWQMFATPPQMKKLLLLMFKEGSSMLHDLGYKEYE